MKILLIQAHTGEKCSQFYKFIYTSVYPSLTLDQIAATTPKIFDLGIIDERYEKIDYNSDADIVGISSLTYSANHAYEIADKFRSKGKTVVLGGYHPSSIPDEAIQHADSVIIGEAEISWSELLKDFETGKIKTFYHSKPVDPQIISTPKRSGKKCITTPIQATRGCPYNCKFCAVHKIEGNICRARPIKKVIEEIESIKSKNLFFADSSLTVNPTYTKQLFKEMKGLGKSFSCYGNINTLSKDEELLKLAREAGCSLWLIGFESINQETLTSIGKKTNIANEYISGIKKIKNYGMMPLGLFMFGFDTDTKSVFDSTINAIYDWGLDKAGFAIITPFPGTKLYDELEKNSRILTKDWSKYNLKNVVFEPKNMTPEELFNGTNRLVNEFYSLPNSIRRAINDKNINPYRFFSRIIGDFSQKKFYKIFGKK